GDRTDRVRARTAAVEDAGGNRGPLPPREGHRAERGRALLPLATLRASRTPRSSPAPRTPRAAPRRSLVGPPGRSPPPRQRSAHQQRGPKTGISRGAMLLLPLGECDQAPVHETAHAFPAGGEPRDDVCGHVPGLQVEGDVPDTG